MHLHTNKNLPLLHFLFGCVPCLPENERVNYSCKKTRLEEIDEGDKTVNNFLRLNLFIIDTFEKYHFNLSSRLNIFMIDTLEKYHLTSLHG